MSGSTLAMTMASSAVESAPSSFCSPPPSPRKMSDLARQSPSSSSSSSGIASAPTHDRSSKNSNLIDKRLPVPPASEILSFEFGSDLDTSFTLSTKDLALRPNDRPASAYATHPSQVPRQTMDRIGKGKALLDRRQSMRLAPRSSPEKRPAKDQSAEEKVEAASESKQQALQDAPTLEKSRTVSDSFAAFARRSWMVSSRSPSPSRNESNLDDDESDARLGRERSASHSSTQSPPAKITRRTSRKRPVSNVETEGGRSPDSRGKIGSYFTKMKQRPQNMRAGGKSGSGRESNSSSTTSLPPASSDTRPSRASETSNSTAPEDFTSRLRNPLPRDPLWSAFKNLESDFSKFHSKSASIRMTMVRNSLLPFLRNHGTQSLHQNLHYEDMERRATILNKWWSGLLEMLDGKAQQTVSGVDRPTLLEVVTLLMMRPEWRHSTPSFAPLAERSSLDSLRRRRRNDTEKSSEGSISTTDSDYFAESAEHNVRTMFVTNLITQVGIAVDKLSLRHAPLALVNFAGKTCAYAFFFVPGVADILVRLWGLTPKIMRRVADELKLTHQNKAESDALASLFPANVSDLAWTSVRTICATLRRPAKLPVTAGKIPWNGSWVPRWQGRDTDLLFIFFKYYFVLSEEFLPAGLTLEEKARAPGFMLVNAQLLSVLDSTVHRQAAAEATWGPPLADATPGADASAMAMPTAPNNNVLRGMSDNRLIVLLKDFLSPASLNFASARHTFAEAFMALMKASAKRTSQFDHSACFTICDFLEEALVVYDGFLDVERPGEQYIDWDFWFAAWSRILESNNSMSEVRILSLVFSIWNTIASNQTRKDKFCQGWLLEEETFSRLFNNWCPMVRAYYMRLLCWRICRDTGHANVSDAQLFSLVSSRLRTAWSHYLWLKQDAEQRAVFPPSTAPSFPAPGKRFMIIRTEVNSVASGLVMGFDHFTNTVSQLDTTPQAAVDSSDSSSSDSLQYKKKWGLLGKVLSFGTGTSVASDLEAVRRDTSAARSKPVPPPKLPSGAVTPPSSDSDSMGSSPTYEAMQYVFKFTLAWNAAGNVTPPNRILTRPRLPAPAQSWVGSKEQADSAPSGSRPGPTRAISGSAATGLINSARNAHFVSSSSDPHLPLAILDSNGSSDVPSSIGSIDETTADPTSKHRDLGLAPGQEPITQPVRPIGAFALHAKYAGRALAEWGLVVGECNGFVDRRQDEGVDGLKDVEIPTLGVEGIRKTG